MIEAADLLSHTKKNFCTYAHGLNHFVHRDALGRKVEADVEAKADFNALKNQWDGIEKDFNTWCKEVSEGWQG